MPNTPIEFKSRTLQIVHLLKQVHFSEPQAETIRWVAGMMTAQTAILFTLIKVFA